MGKKNKSQRFITKLSECKMSIVKPLNSGNIWMWLTTDLQQKRTFRLPETKHGIFPKSHLFAHNSLKIYDWMSLSAFSQNSCISLLSAGHNKQICYVLSYLWDIWTQHSIDLCKVKLAVIILDKPKAKKPTQTCNNNITPFTVVYLLSCTASLNCVCQTYLNHYLA